MISRHDSAATGYLEDVRGLVSNSLSGALCLESALDLLGGIGAGKVLVQEAL